MTRPHRLLLATVCTAAFLSTPAFAQDFLTPQMPDPAAIPSWPMSLPSDEVLVVTVAEPGKRHSCKVKALTPEGITCARSLGRDPVVYKPREVEALINPRTHSHAWMETLLAGGIGAGIMYGAVLLNPISEAAAVTVGIIAAVVILTSPTYLFDGQDLPDHLLYLQPGRELSVALRK